MADDTFNPESQLSDSQRQAIRHVGGDLIDRALEAVQAARDSPRLQLMIAHGVVELAINAMIEEVCKHGKKIAKDHRTYPHSVKLVILHEMGVLSDHYFRLLNWFRELRNDAAHEAFFELKPERLEIFVMPELRKPSHFTLVCNLIIFDLVGEHLHIIGPFFSPSRWSTAKEWAKPSQRSLVQLKD